MLGRGGNTRYWYKPVYVAQYTEAGQRFSGLCALSLYVFLAFSKQFLLGSIRMCTVLEGNCSARVSNRSEWLPIEVWPLMLPRQETTQPIRTGWG